LTKIVLVVTEIVSSLSTDLLWNNLWHGSQVTWRANGHWGEWCCLLHWDI